MKANNSRRRWVTVVFVIILIVALLWLVDIELVLQAIRSADWRLLGAAAVVLLIGFAIEALRQRYFYGNLPSYRETYHVVNVSNMTNLVTLIPVTVIRIFLMSQDESITTARATSSSSLTILFNWIINLVSFLGVVLIIVRTRYLEDYLFLSLLLLAGLIGGIVLLVGNADKLVEKLAPRLARLPIISEEQSVRFLSDLAQGLEPIGSRRRLFGAFGWTLLTWSVGLLYYALAMMAFNVEIPPERLLAGVMFVSILVNAYTPYLPGVYQALMVVPLAVVSTADQTKLTALSIVLYAMLLLIWFGLGFLGLRGLNLSFKGLRQQVTENIQQIRSQSSRDEVDKE